MNIFKTKKHGMDGRKSMRVWGVGLWERVGEGERRNRRILPVRSSLHQFAPTLPYPHTLTLHFYQRFAFAGRFAFDGLALLAFEAGLFWFSLSIRGAGCCGWPALPDCSSNTDGRICWIV